jgi:hypothetical protein
VLAGHLEGVQVKTVTDRPPGYRELGRVLERREKALRFEYYDWKIWIPKKSVVKVRRGPYCAPAWAIDSGKEHGSAR